MTYFDVVCEIVDHYYIIFFISKQFVNIDNKNRQKQIFINKNIDTKSEGAKMSINLQVGIVLTFVL